MNLIKVEVEEQLQHEGDELLKPQTHIWKHIFNFINSMALKCAIQLGIPDAVNSHGHRPMTISEIVSSLKINADKSRCIYRLMRLLVHTGFFTVQKLKKDDDSSGTIEEEEGYILTDSSRLLLKDNPSNLAPFLLSMLDPVLIEPWQFLSTWLQNNDESPFQTAHGLKIWEYFEGKEKEREIFNEAMASDAKLVISILVDRYKWVFEGLESLVDVAGGTGTMAKAIAKAFPQMKCAVLDLPHVVADIEETQNFKVFGGNMFEAIPPADALLFKWIFHDWKDEACVKILRKCKEVITRNQKKGKVIIIDIVVGKQREKDDDEYIETQLLADMEVMSLYNAKERTEKEWVKLFHDAEFINYKIYPILGLRSLIELYP